MCLQGNSFFEGDCWVGCRTNSPTSAVKHADEHGNIRIWATPPIRLVFWDGTPSPYNYTHRTLWIMCMHLQWARNMEERIKHHCHLQSICKTYWVPEKADFLFTDSACCFSGNNWLKDKLTFNGHEAGLDDWVKKKKVALLASGGF